MIEFLRPTEFQYEYHLLHCKFFSQMVFDTICYNTIHQKHILVNNRNNLLILTL